MQFKHLLKNAGLTLPALILLFYSYSNAQSNRDSLFQYSTSTVVITGRGYENKLANSTSAITSINKKELDPLPFNKFSDAVKYLPGFFVFNKDGLGRDPVIGVRGFYGAGEAEYIQVIQDGISLNNIETGLVNWNLIDYENIDRIEVLRGGASALYGEPAIGGVINIFTNNPQSKFNSLNFDAGSFGTFNFGAHSSGILLNNFYGLNASYNKTNGFREHSNWKKFSIGGQYKVNINNASSLNFLLSYFNIDADNPGPLSENELNKSRTSSFVFYKPDAKEERRFYLCQ